MEVKLLKLHPVPVSYEEMAFGIVTEKPKSGILLRNWITFMARELIMKEERLAFHGSTKPNMTKFMAKFHAYFDFEVQMKALRYKNENKSKFFEGLISYREVLCKIGENGVYETCNLFL